MKKLALKFILLFFMLPGFDKLQAQEKIPFIEDSFLQLSKGRYATIYVRVGRPPREHYGRNTYYWGYTTEYEARYVPEIVSRDSVLSYYYRRYMNDGSRSDSSSYYKAFTQQITRASMENDLFYTVTIRTGRDSAVIKYQTVFDRESSTGENRAKRVTNNCNEKIARGWYYIWAERDDKPSSDKKFRTYITEDTAIDIIEKK